MGTPVETVTEAAGPPLVPIVGSTRRQRSTVSSAGRASSELRNTPADLLSLCLKRRHLPQGSAFWGSHRWKIFFQREYPFPQIFKGHFTCKSKSRITFDR
jgi:hypothetical protein